MTCVPNTSKNSTSVSAIKRILRNTHGKHFFGRSWLQIHYSIRQIQSSSTYHTQRGETKKEGRMVAIQGAEGRVNIGAYSLHLGAEWNAIDQENTGLLMVLFLRMVILKVMSRQGSSQHVQNFTFLSAGTPRMSHSTVKNSGVKINSRALIYTPFPSSFFIHFSIFCKQKRAVEDLHVR